MVFCAVKLCRHHSNSEISKAARISFHLFPKDPARKRAWVAALKNGEAWIPTKHSRVCSVHFTEACYKTLKSIRGLQEDAVPIVNLYQETNVQESSVPSTIEVSEIRRLKFIIQNKNKKIKRLNQNIRRKKIKIQNLQKLLHDITSKNLITETEAYVLENISVESKELLKRQVKATNTGKNIKTKYSPELRRFALTLNYYSPKAYLYVRRVYNTCLPHPSTLSKWYQCIGGDPGFTKEAFTTLKEKAGRTTYPLLCSLMFDEMAISRRVEWDGKKFHGYVDFGTGIPNDCHLAEAKDVLVMLVVGINSSFKVPVAYFLVDGVKGDQRANLVRQSLINCHEAGIKVVSITSDGCPANISAMTILGCRIDKKEVKVSFPHPVTSEPVFIFLDPSHMIKLIRNAFQSFGTLVDSDGQIIKWNFLEQLNNLQIKEYFHLSNKLSPYHINFKNNIMKVKLATQLLSASVCEALTFCEKELHLSEFQNVSATANFLKIMNDLFDILNSRNLYQKNLKEAMNQTNFKTIFSILDSTKKYLQNLKLPNEKCVLDTKRKVGFLGLIVCIDSTKGLFEEVIINKKILSFLPLYKVSQDHIELLFSNFRSHGGPNNNPTAKQLKTIYKKILTHVELRETQGSNCIPLENISILNCSSVSKINRTSGVYDCDHIEENVCPSSFDYSKAEWSEFSENIISYIAGFVVSSIMANLCCETCIRALINGNLEINSLKFLMQKNKGGLICPSPEVVVLCKKSEFILRECLHASGGHLLKPFYTTKFIVSKVLHDFVGESLFESISFHQFDQTFPESNHLLDLSKAVIEKYITVRMHYITKRQSYRISKRQLFNKLNLFSGQ